MAKSRVAVFIDLANINGGFDGIKRKQNAPDLRLDFLNLINILTLGSEIVSKTIYTETRLDPEEQSKKKGFLLYLKNIGFNVVTKDCKVINSNGVNHMKANFDVEIAVDACRCIWRRDCNEIILVSGDSDFAYLLSEAERYDIKTTVVSTNDSISKELRALAHRIILLDDLDLKQITNTK